MASLSWIDCFDLFLFDFDGLLVNTESLHFAAYIEMCHRRGFALDWNFFQFCTAAHFTSSGVRDALYSKFPSLHSLEPNWDILYTEKKEIYLTLLKKGNLSLMPGVEAVLTVLNEGNRKRCVVTHSPKEQIDLIREALPLLNSIPDWIAREDYQKPKPDPECYIRAIEKLGHDQDRVVGFEDSIRGLRALSATKAYPILVCDPSHPQMKDGIPNGCVHFESFEEISKEKLFFY